MSRAIASKIIKIFRPLRLVMLEASKLNRGAEKDKETSDSVVLDKWEGNSLNAFLHFDVYGALRLAGPFLQQNSNIIVTDSFSLRKSRLHAMFPAFG